MDEVDGLERGELLAQLDDARVEAEALAMGGKPEFLSAGEAAAAMQTNDGLVGRPWELWKRHAEGKS